MRARDQVNGRLMHYQRGRISVKAAVIRVTEGQVR